MINLEHPIDHLALAIVTAFAGHDEPEQESALDVICDMITAEILRAGGTAGLADEIVQAIVAHVGELRPISSTPMAGMTPVMRDGGHLISGSFTPMNPSGHPFAVRSENQREVLRPVAPWRSQRRRRSGNRFTGQKMKHTDSFYLSKEWRALRLQALRRDG